AAAVAVGQAVGYRNAGTIECLVFEHDGVQDFAFLEMNTRLQVEHPVTELITGVDLVEQMIRVAAGEPLAFGQDDIGIKGWAIESRLYAEDPYRGFLPSIGRLVRYSAPADGERGGGVVRTDSGVREGDEISMFYDPMIAKLATWGPDRAAATDAMAVALESLHIEGLGHNAAFLSAVMDQDRFKSGVLSTGYIAEEFPDGFHGLAPTPRQLDIMTVTAAAMHRLQTRRNGVAHPVLKAARPRDEWVVVLGTEKRRVRLVEEGAALEVDLLDERRALHLTAHDWRPGQRLFSGVLDGATFSAEVAPAAEGFTIRHRAASRHVLVLTPVSADLHERLPPKKAADTSKMVLSPMPGLVVAVEVGAGEEVKAGQTLLILEAMKMQNIIRAERDGVLKAVNAKAGDSVGADELLAEFA
ncbi:MAG TPA: biotin/lipoyl-containing protein, partial [Caulobacteraceae bacterium]